MDPKLVRFEAIKLAIQVLYDPVMPPEGDTVVNLAKEIADFIEEG